MDIFVWPYKSASQSAKDLARTLNTSTIKRQGSTVVDKTNRLIINWGDSSRCPYRQAKVLNAPSKVALAVNKLLFFNRISNRNSTKNSNDSSIVNIPEYSDYFNSVVSTWLTSGNKVCARSILNGNSGQGLTITNVRQDIPRDAPLYTKYIPKSAEYRIHIINGIIVEAQKKVWPSTRPSTGVDFTQRNYNDGFVFQSCKLGDVSFLIYRQALNAVAALELDFAGVDVIMGTDGKAYVLEVNTAPGIEGKDLTIYSSSFRDIAQRYSQS